MEMFENAVKLLKEKMANEILEFRVPKPRRAYFLLKTESHKKVISALMKNDENLMLSTITGVDLGNEIELNYHLACEGSVTLKNRVSREKPFHQNNNRHHSRSKFIRTRSV